MHTMKSRVTLTVDPLVMSKAKKVAHSRRTSVSGLIESLIRQIPDSTGKPKVSFADKWAGKFQLRQSRKPDPKLKYLKKRYGLEDA